MDSVLNLLDNDQSFDFSTFTHEAPRSQVSSTSTLLQAIEGEIAGLASRISAVTSILNALSSPDGPAVAAGTLDRFLPPPPLVFPAVIGRLAATLPDIAVVNAIQHYYAQLRCLCDTTHATLNSQSDAPAQIGLHLEILADAWRSMCSATIDIDHAIQALHPAASPSKSCLIRCRPHLARAAAGDWPCIGTDGFVEVPGLVERRLAIRHKVYWDAILVTGDVQSAIVIQNISQRGLGATCIRRLNKGSDVTVLVRHRSLNGRIAWCSGGKFGLQLDQPIPPGDPLMAKAARQTTQPEELA